MSKPITSSTDSSLSTPSSASALSTTAVPASTTAVTATIFASASSSLQFDPPQQTMAPFDTESHLYDYDSDSEEKNSGVKRPYTAEKLNLQMQAKMLTPLNLKVVSLQTILEGLNIPKADCDNYIFGARQYYAIESMGEMEPRVFIAQGKCLENGREIPLSLYSFIVQLELLLSKSDRDRLLGSSSMESASPSTTVSASASSLSMPSSASASSTTSSASASSRTTAAASASLESGPGLKTIESILDSLEVPENFRETHILGVKLYFGNRKKYKKYNGFLNLQGECVAKTYNAPYAIETLIKRLDVIIPESERELFLKNLSKGPEEEKGSK